MSTLIKELLTINEEVEVLYKKQIVDVAQLIGMDDMELDELEELLDDQEGYTLKTLTDAMKAGFAGHTVANEIFNKANQLKK